MDKNRIEGRYGTTSWHKTAKSSGLPVEVNAAVVQGSTVSLPGEICRERSGQKSAEAIVVVEMSRSALAHVKETGGLTRRRAELVGSVLTAWRTVVTNEAGRRGDAESRDDGKHVGAQWWISVRCSHGLVP